MPRNGVLAGLAREGADAGTSPAAPRRPRSDESERLRPRRRRPALAREPRRAGRARRRLHDPPRIHLRLAGSGGRRLAHHPGLRAQPGFRARLGLPAGGRARRGIDVAALHPALGGGLPHAGAESLDAGGRSPLLPLRPSAGAAGLAASRPGARGRWGGGVLVVRPPRRHRPSPRHLVDRHADGLLDLARPRHGRDVHAGAGGAPGRDAARPRRDRDRGGASPAGASRRARGGPAPAPPASISGGCAARSWRSC
jgi:hypothetical protein